MKFPNITNEFWLCGMAFDSFTKELCLPQWSILGIRETGTGNIWRRGDSDTALGPPISSAIHWVVFWVRAPPSICTWISYQRKEFVLALAWVPLSTGTWLLCFVLERFTLQVADCQVVSSAGFWLGLALRRLWWEGRRVGGRRKQGSKEAALPLPQALSLEQMNLCDSHCSWENDPGPKLRTPIFPFHPLLSSCFG